MKILRETSKFDYSKSENFFKEDTSSFILNKNDQKPKEFKAVMLLKAIVIADLRAA
jgi:hypothetical protein